MTLEDQLADLAVHLDAPVGDALAKRVGARVRARRGRATRRRLVLAFAALVVLVLVVSLVPAVGEWLGVRGVEVRQEPPPTSTEDRSLDLGSASTLAAASRRAGFTPLVPASLGRPDEVWLDERTAVAVVTLVYADGPLISQFRAAVADVPVIRKFAAGDVIVEEVEVDGRRAVWVDGVHEVATEVPGRMFVDRLRLSDSALLVEIGEITARIETRAGRDDAVRIARNLVAAAGVEGP